jgi:biotin operon repressor
MAAKPQLNTRVLLTALSGKPASAVELIERLGVTRATLQHYLTLLLEAGLLVREGKGPAMSYRLKTLPETQAETAPVPSTTVHLEMSEDTAARVFAALELYSRMGIGQFGELLGMARMGMFKRSNGDEITEDQLDEAENHLINFKQALLGMPSNASFSVLSPHVSPVVKEVWSVSKSIRHRLAWDRTPAGQMGTHHDEPMDYDLVTGLKVHSAPSNTSLVDLSELPEGMLMQFKDGKYRVIGPSSDSQALQFVSESRSWQTAISMAKNVDRGDRPRAIAF